MATAREEFVERVNRLLREGRDLPEEVIRRMIRELEDARREALARMAGLPNEGYTRFQLERVEQDLGRLLDELGRRLGAQVGAGQRRGFDIGAAVVDEPFGRAGLGFSFGRLPLEQLAAATDYSARLITQISRETRGQIDLALRRSLIGGKPFAETIREIAGALGGTEKGPPSLWSKAGERAFRIAATEIPTVQAIASDARIGQMAERYGKGAVQKQWRHHPVARVPRVGHLMLGASPAIPVDERFENPETGALLRFPHDSAVIPDSMSASENIQCSCSMAPHIVASSALDKRFEASRARALAA
jgi:hypothetical protein